MIFTHKYDILFIFAIVLLLNNCQFIWNNEGYKSELVIMAILTNGHKNHSHKVRHIKPWYNISFWLRFELENIR